jgi:2-methylcitrate dehydratase PrpD
VRASGYPSELKSTVASAAISATVRPSSIASKEDPPMSPGVTARLSEFAARTSFDSLPAEVVGLTRRCLLNYLGLVIGALDEPAVVRALALVRELGGTAQATVLGTSLHTSAPQAALVNGVAADVLDFDDPDLAARVPRTGPAMSAALAVGEWRGVSGRDLITAFAVGCELECRVGLAVHPAHHDAGWHVSGTVGTFGAAAAAARLLDLAPPQMSTALSLAGAQAAGLQAQFGFMARSYQVGKAAANGVLAAILAGQGFEASDRIFEGRHGFSEVYSNRQHLDRLTDALGQHWELDSIGRSIADQALRERVHDLVWAYLPRWKEERLFELVDSLPDLDSISTIAELLEPVEGGEP